MKIKYFLLTISVLLFAMISCITTDPPPPPPNGEKPTLELTLEDVSCTETWIKLTTTNLTLPAKLVLKQINPAGDTVSQISTLNTQDSLLYIDSLLPNQTYQYRVSSIPHSGEQDPATSNELNVTTMDTTSHNFTFETFTFGGTAGSSTLYDVAIISPDNIWAVGEMFVADTSQNGYTMYNAVHWDGSEWELKRIKTNACGGVEYPPIKTIFAFSGDDILFAHIDGSITHYNGIEFINDCSLITQLNGSANKIWGISKNDYYVVSDGGFIAHYNGTNWQRIESGTELDFHDIYGATDLHTGEEQILAVCSRNLPLDKGIYKIQENIATQISSDPIQWELAGVWFVPNRHYYVVGAGIYEKKFLSEPIWKDNGFDITHYITPKIRGNNLNDVFAVGAFGETIHFNGATWKSYIEQTGLNTGGYFTVSLQSNTIVAVGFEYQSAVVIIGKRTN